MLTRQSKVANRLVLSHVTKTTLKRQHPVWHTCCESEDQTVQDSSGARFVPLGNLYVNSLPSDPSETLLNDQPAMFTFSVDLKSKKQELF